MISSATLFLATLVFHAAAVLGAPVSLPAEIAPRSVDASASVRFARDASFPETFPTVIERAVVDSVPIVVRETEELVRRYPRRFIHEYLEKRGTTIHEKVTVTEKTIKHDNPIDTVAYNNGHPQNNNNGNAGPDGSFTTTIAFSTTIHIPGAPTPTGTSTVPAAAAPSPTPTGVAPGPANPAGGPTGTTPVAGNNGSADPAKPADCTATPDAPSCTKPADGSNPNATTPGADPTKPANGSTTTDGTQGADPNAKPDGTNPATTTTTTTDGTTPAGTPPTTPDGTTPTADGGNTTTDGGNPTTPATEGAQRRGLAYSGAAYASSLRRRAL